VVSVIVATVGAGVTSALAVTVVPAPSSARIVQFEPVVEPGEIVAALQETGEVVAIDDRGAVRTLVAGLAQPRAVQVLQDRSIVIAEAGADRLVGIGGRYGTTLTPITGYPFPSGLYQALDGTVYVTSFSEGRLSTVDLRTGSVTDLATGLDTPGGLIVRNGTAYIAELNGQRVVSVDQAGRVNPIAQDFQGPLGVAGGRGAALFVADYAANEVVRYENGERTVLASLAGPRAIVSDPVVPRSDEPYRLIVSFEQGIVEVDPETGTTDELISVAGAVGVTTVRGEATTTPTTPTGGSVPLTPGLDQQGGGDGAEGSEPSGSPMPVVVLGLVILAGLGGFLFVQLRMAHATGDEDDDAGARTGDETLHEAFGPCVTQELELERAQAALDSLLAQVEALQRVIEHGEAAAVEARARLQQAQAARQVAVSQRAVGGGEEPPADRSHPIHEAELHLSTDEGRAALASYRRGEIGPVDLARRWAELDEREAIATVRAAGERARQVDLTVPGPDEREATADLAEAEADMEHARADLTRLAARERECRATLAEADKALEACREANRGDAPEKGQDPDQLEAWGAGAPPRTGTEPAAPESEPSADTTPPPPAPDTAAAPPPPPAPDTAAAPPPPPGPDTAAGTDAPERPEPTSARSSGRRSLWKGRGQGDAPSTTAPGAGAQGDDGGEAEGFLVVPDDPAGG
jgi:hypothetical protein